MSETRLRCSGTPEQIEEFAAAAAPTEPPTAKQIREVFEAMRAAGFKPQPL